MTNQYNTLTLNAALLRQEDYDDQVNILLALQDRYQMTQEDQYRLNVAYRTIYLFHLHLIAAAYELRKQRHLH